MQLVSILTHTLEAHKMEHSSQDLRPLRTILQDKNSEFISRNYVFPTFISYCLQNRKSVKHTLNPKKLK